MGVYTSDATLDQKKQQLVQLYKSLYLRQGMDPTLADRLANDRAQRETFGGRYPQNPGDTLAQLEQESNLANEGRYGQLLDTNASGKSEQTGFLDAEADTMRGLAGAGLDVNLARNQRRANTAKGNTAGSLYARGLGNSTVLDSFNTQIDDNLALQDMQAQADATKEKLGVEDTYTGRKLGVLSNSNRDRESIIQERTDQPPNLGLYGQYLSQAGAANVGGWPAGVPIVNYGGGAGGGGTNFGSPNVSFGAPRPPAYEAPSTGANIYTGAYRSPANTVPPALPVAPSGSYASGNYGGAYSLPPGTAGPISGAGRAPMGDLSPYVSAPHDTWAPGGVASAMAGALPGLVLDPMRTGGSGGSIGPIPNGPGFASPYGGGGIGNPGSFQPIMRSTQGVNPNAAPAAQPVLDKTVADFYSKRPPATRWPGTPAPTAPAGAYTQPYGQLSAALPNGMTNPSAGGGMGGAILRRRPRPLYAM